VRARWPTPPRRTLGSTIRATVLASVLSTVDRRGGNARRGGLRAALTLAVSTVLVLSVPASARAKGFTRAMLIGSNGHWVEVRAKESVIDGLLSSRGSGERLRGGYVRLFFGETRVDSFARLLSKLVNGGCNERV
jgi:hypothetical protein